MKEGLCTVAFAQRMWDELMSGLELGVESAWTALARLVGDPDSEAVTLLIYRVIPVPDEAYVQRERDGLVIRSAGWLPAFAQADHDGSVPVFIHTHPDALAEHSKRDLVVDDHLAHVARVRTGLEHYASLVVAGRRAAPTIAGRFKPAAADWRVIKRARVVGERATLLTSNADNKAALPIFDRQVLAFGEDGQRILEALRVGVVGAGGTGSAVIEQLVRLGVKEIVAIDPQALSDTNVTRVYGSILGDFNTPKVEVASKHARQIGLGATVRPLQGSVLERDVIDALVHCDVIFGCTDDNASRVVLTRLPQALLQLFVDCGVVIDSRDGELFDVFGRVSTVGPTSACLVCMDDIDLQRAAAEAMPDEEREALAREGYVPELDTADPSVVTYTTITASFAVNELLSRLFGYCDADPANRILIRIGSRAISKMRREIRGTHRCGRSDLLAIGTQEPFLGYGWSA